MTAPEDRRYCLDLWCDGDHLSSGERCYRFDTDPDHPDAEPEDDEGLTSEPDQCAEPACDGDHPNRTDEDGGQGHDWLDSPPEVPC